jgi:hypothetical protein
MDAIGEGRLPAAWEHLGPVIGAQTELLGKLIDRVADSGLTVGRALQNGAHEGLVVRDHARSP